MDIDLLRDGEHFSTFDSVNFLDPYPDEGTTLDSVHSFLQHEYEWTLEGEQEINGDIALIPVCDMNLTNINEIPSNVDDFQKIMNDWHQFINVDPGTEFTIEETLINPKNHDPDPIIKKDDNDVLNTNNFDLTEYLNDIEPSPSSSSGSSSSQRKHKAGVKKIDLKAQRYIIDEEDDVDVETISECEESSPVLEAKDLNSLLEQFEATQLPHLPENFIDNTPNLLEEVTENIPGHIFEEELVKDVKVKVEQEIIEVEESVIKQEPVDDDYKYGCGRRKENDKRNRKIDKRKSKDMPKDVGTKTELKEQATPAVVKQEPPSPIHKPSLKPSTPKHVTPAQLPQLTPKHVTPAQSPQSTPKHVTPAQTPQSTPDSKKCPETPPKSTESTPKPEPAQKQSPKETKPKISEATTKAHEITTKKTETTPKLSETPQKSHETPAPVTPNKQILDSLPQELIARIKESGKRKPISVIPPIPTRKRGCPRSLETNAQVPKNKIIKLAGAETVQLDHDYCSVGAVEPYPKNPKKDSGFESAEEDDRTMIGKQPTVKNADGKLMVSLLKVNTIHSTNKTIQKKKLNFEEYKKRREGLMKSHNNSQDCSPISSTCSSPLPEDENTRLLRHQEKLMRMAMEVLNTPPKGEKKPETPLVITPPQPVQVPPDMVMKTLVSIGVNTDFKVRRKNLDPLAPVERLDEMKPLLQRVSDKINCNSLITSVIENIPKVIASCDPHHRETIQNKDKLEHGEDKTIVFLPKNRICKQTNSVECQTNISLIQQTKASRYRRRNISNSSSSSDSSESSRQSRSTARRHNRNRSSNTSRCSSSSKGSRSSKSNRSSSTYSSRSSSRSRSRSSSPRYSKREKERLREVEERRVIYVGRIITGTTREDLRKRFQRFGPITNISLHSRDHTYLDNYGFVTFANKLDAYEAIEHGNDDPWHPKYDLSFGGRRIFCQTGYSDLDNVRDEIGYFAPRPPADDSFDKLLREVQEKMRKRKA